MERSERPERHRARNFAGVLLTGAVFAGGALTVAGFLNRNEPVNTSGPAKEQPRVSDSQVRVATYNVARDGLNQLANIRLLMRQERLDALMLQEVTTSDSRQIQQTLKQDNLYVSYKLADGRQKPQDGGLGDMIITPTKQYDAYARIMEGDSSSLSLTKTAAGAASDIGHGISESIATITAPSINFKQAKRGLTENREIMFVKTKIDGGTEVQLINTHIAAGPAAEHQQQLSTVLQYAASAATKDIPVIFCGDFNQTPTQMTPNIGQIVPAFGDRGFLTGSTKAVSTIGQPGNPASRIDYCFVHSTSQLGMPTSWTVPGIRSDHRPVALAAPLLSQESSLAG